MSIMQDFEEARKIIGPEKYDAIEKYLDEVCPKSNYDKYNKELNSMLDYSTDEWLKQKKELEEKIEKLQIELDNKKEEKYKIKKFFYHESLFKINLLNKYRQNTSLKNPFMI